MVAALAPWIIPAGSLMAVCIVVLIHLLIISRGAVGPLEAEKPPIPVALPQQLVDPHVIRVLSERLSVLEGRLPAMQASNDGYAAMAIRLAELEGRLPVLADAYDKFSQMTLNADKRAADRDKRSRSRAQTVEEAAAQMGLAGDPKATAPVEAATRTNGTPGVMGSGGSVRR